MGSSRGGLVSLALGMGVLGGLATFYVMEPAPAVVPERPAWPAAAGLVEVDGYAPAIAIARAIAEEAQRAGMPGLSVAVGVAGELIWAEGFGWADIENGVPAGPPSPTVTKGAMLTRRPIVTVPSTTMLPCAM